MIRRQFVRGPRAAHNSHVFPAAERVNMVWEARHVQFNRHPGDEASTMIAHAWLLAFLLLGSQVNRDGPDADAADRVTLRDGKVVLGACDRDHAGAARLGGIPGPARLGRNKLKTISRGGTARPRERPVRPSHNGGRGSKHGGKIGQPVQPANDRIVSWIDQELARLTAGGAPKAVDLDWRAAPSQRGPRIGPTAGGNAAAVAARLALQPSRSRIDAARRAEGRTRVARYSAEARRGATPPSLTDCCRRLWSQSQSGWPGAATELAVDPDLRFLRFQDTVMPEPAAGQPRADWASRRRCQSSSACSTRIKVSGLIPLTEKLNAVAARGRIGAVVTRLEIQPDMSTSSSNPASGSETVIGGSPFGSRAATVRPEDLGQDAGKRSRQIPRFKARSRIVESLGLGAIPADLKQRSCASARRRRRRWGWLGPLSTRTFKPWHCPSWNHRMTVPPPTQLNPRRTRAAIGPRPERDDHAQITLRSPDRYWPAEQFRGR